MARMGEVVLHIGSGKTGTSTVQRFLADRRGDLLAEGVLYPEAYGGVRHTHLSNAARPDRGLTSSLAWRRSRHTDPSAYREEHRARLAAELARHRPDRVLFSDEGLYALGGVALGNLRGMLDALGEYADARTVIVYLRRPEDHLVSRYQQSVKTGCVDTLVEFAARDHGNIYDYARRLDLWSGAMAPARLVVRPFEPASFVGGSLVGDFVDAAGLRLDVPPEAGGRRNESLDADAVELLRLLNVDAVEGGERSGAIDNRDVVDRLAALPRGPVLTLPEAALEEFARRWEASTAEVARRHGDGRPLFGPRRPARDTTVVQALTPERLTELADAIALAPERRERVTALLRAAGSDTRQ
jgi:hypothetical protein